MSEDDDKFFEQLRRDAAPLRHEPDAFAVRRIAARIRERLEPPTVAQLLAAWFRPLAATLTAVALAATIGASIANRRANESMSLAAYNNTGTVEIAVAGDSYSVSGQ